VAQVLGAPESNTDSGETEIYLLMDKAPEAATLTEFLLKKIMTYVLN
jgi:hypothetical protein